MAGRGDPNTTRACSRRRRPLSVPCFKGARAARGQRIIGSPVLSFVERQPLSRPRLKRGDGWRKEAFSSCSFEGSGGGGEAGTGEFQHVMRCARPLRAH